jgi:hypothetical protein
MICRPVVTKKRVSKETTLYYYFTGIGLAPCLMRHGRQMHDLCRNPAGTRLKIVAGTISLWHQQVFSSGPPQ